MVVAVVARTTFGQSFFEHVRSQSSEPTARSRRRYGSFELAAKAILHASRLDIGILPNVHSSHIHGQWKRNGGDWNELVIAVSWS